MEAAAPKQLGRYEVVSLLAQGGMAELYLAKLPGIEGFAKRVVIKRVLPSLARDREFVEMFLEEARLASTLHHQNIVHVHDIGHDSTGYFFAMEYLHGVDIGDIMRHSGGPLPLPIALEIARGACAGLHYAHERVDPSGRPLGIVHRDVSPQNVFVTFDGSAKLLDFGIAKAVQQISNQYTRSGTLRGKLPYMSPEQGRSERIDRRSDVFSLAIVLWEMTVGQRLFGANNQSDFEILKSIVEVDAPRPSTVIADYPHALEAIVMRGLARDRDARYQTADALQADLETFVRGHGAWATSRDVTTYLRGRFGDQAAASLRIDSAELAKEADIVPFPKPTRPIPEPRPTEEVPQRPPTAATVPSMPPTAVRGRKRSAVPLVIGAVAIAGISIVVGYALRGTPDAPAPSSPVSPVPAPSTAPPPATAPAPSLPGAAVAQGTLDVHWFGANDYIIQRQGDSNQWLRVAQLMGTVDARGQGSFLAYSEGREYQTATFWRTRIAIASDLVVGAYAFCQGTVNDAKCHAPKDKKAAHEHNWMRGRITDITELPDRVTVASCVCDVAGVRVAVSPR